MEISENKILFVGFCEPDPINANRTAVSQVLELKRRGFDVDMLACSQDGIWRGLLPDDSSPKLAGVPHLYAERMGITAHIISLPNIWTERTLTEKEWETAVQWGVAALKHFRPRLLHLQQWQYLWWIMESALRLDIPVIYSANDFGLGCMRNLLLNGWEALCDGHVASDKCAECIVAGRNSLGKLNETVARMPMGEMVLSSFFGDGRDSFMARAGAIRIPVERRVDLALQRCRRVLPNVRAVIAASPFAGDYFLQFGVRQEAIHVIPWFYDQGEVCGPPPEVNSVLRLGMVTRVSSDKGVHILLEALERVRAKITIELTIVGSTANPYAKELIRKYPGNAGPNQVVWRGWVPNGELNAFYRDIHVSLVPSLWYDNTPLTLIEALAHGKPVICTDVPSMTHLVRHEENGLVFPLGDVSALATLIERVANNPELVGRYSMKTRNVPSVEDYVDRLANIYSSVLQQQLGSPPTVSHSHEH